MYYEDRDLQTLPESAWRGACAGGSAIRQWIMKSSIVELLPHALQNACPKVVVGGLWIIHNLCKGCAVPCSRLAPSYLCASRCAS